jgi:hypothetical protein
MRVRRYAIWGQDWDQRMGWMRCRRGARMDGGGTGIGTGIGREIRVGDVGMGASRRRRKRIQTTKSMGSRSRESRRSLQDKYRRGHRRYRCRVRLRKCSRCPPLQRVGIGEIVSARRSLQLRRLPLRPRTPQVATATPASTRTQTRVWARVRVHDPAHWSTLPT